MRPQKEKTRNFRGKTEREEIGISLLRRNIFLGKKRGKIRDACWYQPDWIKLRNFPIGNLGFGSAQLRRMGAREFRFSRHGHTWKMINLLPFSIFITGSHIQHIADSSNTCFILFFSFLFIFVGRHMFYSFFTI